MTPTACANPPSKKQKRRRRRQKKRKEKRNLEYTIGPVTGMKHWICIHIFNSQEKNIYAPFLQQQVKYLGHLIDLEGLYPTHSKFAAIFNAAEPKNVLELRSCLGMLQCYKCLHTQTVMLSETTA